eukprot:6148618-Amphidinium_carterae.1
MMMMMMLMMVMMMMMMMMMMGMNSKDVDCGTDYFFHPLVKLLLNLACVVLHGVVPICVRMTKTRREGEVTIMGWRLKDGLEYRFLLHIFEKAVNVLTHNHML